MFVVGVTAATLRCAFYLPDVPHLWDSPLKAAISFVVLLSVLLVFHDRDRLSRPARTACLAAVGLFIAVAGLQAFQLMHLRARTLPEWDVRVFWIYGQLVAHGENVYAREPYAQFYQQLNPSRLFSEDVLQVGGTYPPPTMFLFRPLGYWGMPAAFVCWYVFVGLSLLVAIELLRRIFLPEDGYWGLALVALLIFFLRGTWDTIRFGQTNFLALLLLTLHWRKPERPPSAVWVALAATVKIYTGVVLLDAVLLKRWRVLLWAALSAAALLVASVFLLGPTTFVSYFTLHPTSRVPGWAYVESTNQSLLATVLRLTHAPITSGSLAMNPTFLVCAFLLTAATAWIVYRQHPESVWRLPLWLLLALIIYPGTLAHYSVMLLPVLLIIWKERTRSAIGVAGSALLLTLIVALVGFHSWTFIANLVTWIAIAALAIGSKRLATFSPTAEEASRV